jgi:hypothetical protein
MFRPILKAAVLNIAALAVACTVASPCDSHAQEFPALTMVDMWNANFEFDRQFLRYAWQESCKWQGIDPTFTHCYVNPHRINEPGVRSEETHRVRPYLRDEYIVFDPVMGEVKLFPALRSSYSYSLPIPYRVDLWYGPSPSWNDPEYGPPNYPTPHYPTYYPGYFPSNYPWYDHPSHDSTGNFYDHQY